VKVGFLVNDLQLSGGIAVVVAYARELRLRHGFDAQLVLVREQDDPHWDHQALRDVPVVTLAEAREAQWDVAISTWWETAFSLFHVPAHRYVSFVQSLEDRFYRPREAERDAARLVLDLPVHFLTEARWIAELLRDLRPDATVHFVRNGIDKTVFAGVDHPEPSLRPRPLRVLVEGNPSSWFKGVPQAIAAVNAMDEPRRLTVVTGERADLDRAGIDVLTGPVSQAEMARLYADSDVLVKLSSVEGMYGPPLEAFHMGATCVTTEVTGHDEYIRHGHNALVVDWDDERGTARMLDLLARDRRLLHELRTNAMHTARGWPDWEQSGQFMAAALRTIARGPEPSAPAAAARMAADVRAGLESNRIALSERQEALRKLARVERVTKLPIVAKLLHARRRRSVRIALAPVRWLIARRRGG
jgi:glycosyltransferase involved in cell wall biosynthesis